MSTNAKGSQNKPEDVKYLMLEILFMFIDLVNLSRSTSFFQAPFKITSFMLGREKKFLKPIHC